MKLFALAACSVATAWASQQQPMSFRLDREAGIGGIVFGQPATQIAGFEQQFRKWGKPQLRTQLYVRPEDTVRLRGLRAPIFYWFRQGKFIGADLAFFPHNQVGTVVKQLTRHYGPPQVDEQARHWYWLGQTSFISLDVNADGTGSLLVGSLAMLNELVEETPVRARARQLVGWRPDSIGLPKQLRLRH